MHASELRQHAVNTIIATVKVRALDMSFYVCVRVCALTRTQMYIRYMLASIKIDCAVLSFQKKLNNDKENMRERMFAEKHIQWQFVTQVL